MATTKLPSLSFLFFSAALLCLVAPSSADPETEAMIHRICKLTLDPAFCNDILFRNLISPKTNLSDLTKLTVDISVSFAQYVVTVIQKLEDGIRMNPAILQSYGKGQRAYEEIVELLKAAKGNADRGDFGGMVVQLLQCAKPLAVSESIFGNVIVPMRDGNKKMKVLISMALYERSQMG